MPRQMIAAMLKGVDRRSIGRSDEVVRLVLQQPKLFHELISCLWHENLLVRLRSADATEKVSAENPRLLDRYKPQLLGLLAETTQIELRWHLAQIVPRLRLTPIERKRVTSSLRRYLDDRSSIVRTFALQALFDLSHRDAAHRSETKGLLEEAVQSGTPAMKARARKLLKNLPP